jgi:phospholipid transport system substrate-binding protein
VPPVLLPDGKHLPFFPLPAEFGRVADGEGSMNRQYLVKLFLVLFALMGAVSVRAADDASQVVKSTTSEVMDRVRSDKETLQGNPAKMYSLVSEMIFPHFDFEIMSQWVLGTSWKTTEPAKQQAFVEQFRRLLVRTYATALLEYSDQTIEYPPAEPSNNPKTATVKQDIRQSVGKILPVVYRLHNKTGDWKVFDVEVDGISLVKTFKSSFQPIIAEGGIDKLLENLKEKNKDLGV